MGKDAKKAVVSDEWRNNNVEERLEFSLIKVCTVTQFVCGKCQQSWAMFKIS